MLGASWVRVVFLIWVGVSLTVHLLALPYIEDDAFIHIRNSAHLWEYGLPFFNLSSPCLSSSSVLWMLIISPFAALGDNQEYGLAILNGILSVWTAHNASNVSKKLWQDSSRYAFYFTGALVYAAILPSSLALMESTGALFLMTVVILGVINRSRYWGVLAILLPLMRPECILAFPLLAAYRVKQREWSLSPVEVALPTLVICAVWGWYLSIFGALLPQSIIAKSIVYQITFSQFWKFLLVGITGSSLPRVVTLNWLVIFLLLLLIGTRRLHALTQSEVRSLRLSLTVLLFPVVLIFAYASRQVLIFQWYVPLITAPIILAITPLWQKKFTFTNFVGIVGVLPIISTGILSALIPLIPEYSVFGGAGSRAATLKKIGAVISSIRPESVIVAPEIGGIGRGFPRDIVDGAGLASPEVLRFHPLNIPQQRSAGYLGSVPPELVREKEPDFIVGLPTLLEAVARSPEISKYVKIEVPISYTSLAGTRRPIKVWGNDYIVIFVREALAQAVKDQLFKINR